MMQDSSRLSVPVLMTFEVVCTRTRSGLDPGSSGYCTVARTPRTPHGLQKSLESIDELAAGDHDAFLHATKEVDGEALHVVGRLRAGGMDTKRRKVRIGSYLALSARETPKAGPGWLLVNGRFHKKYEREPAEFDGPPELPKSPTTGKVADMLKRLTRNTGQADRLAGSVAAGEVVWVVYPAGLPIVYLFLEASLLLPEKDRWKATFCSDFDSETFPEEMGCLWRGVPSGSREIARIRKLDNPKILNLVNRATASDSEKAEDDAAIETEPKSRRRLQRSKKRLHAEQEDTASAPLLDSEDELGEVEVFDDDGDFPAESAPEERTPSRRKSRETPAAEETEPKKKRRGRSVSFSLPKKEKEEEEYDGNEEEIDDGEYEVETYDDSEYEYEDGDYGSGEGGFDYDEDEVRSASGRKRKQSEPIDDEYAEAKPTRRRSGANVAERDSEEEPTRRRSRSQKQESSGASAGGLSMNIDGRKAGIVVAVIAALGLIVVFGPGMMQSDTGSSAPLRPRQQGSSAALADQVTEDLVRGINALIEDIERKSRTIRAWDGVSATEHDLDALRQDVQRAATTLSSSHTTSQLETVKQTSIDSYNSTANDVRDAIELAAGTVAWFNRVRLVGNLLAGIQDQLQSSGPNTVSREAIEASLDELSAIDTQELPRSVRSEIARLGELFRTAEAGETTQETREVALSKDGRQTTLDASLPRARLVETYSIRGTKTDAQKIDVEEVASDTASGVLRRFQVFSGNDRIGEVSIRNAEDASKGKLLVLRFTASSTSAAADLVGLTLLVEGPLFRREYRLSQPAD